ncbi:MAG: hypothetical protein LBF42_03605, partial [Puniceicoccales bacterium]|nr:hypothetical protein [Puniceicoccales bacterium]
MSRRAGSAGENSRVSVDPSQVSGANIGVLGQRQETLSLPENSGMPRRSPRSRCPSPTPGEAGMGTRDTKTVTDQVGAAAGQSSTDDQAYIPSKIKLEILAVVVSALAMVATVGFGIAPFTAIIAAVIFAASVSLLIRHVRESFAETRKALGKVKELRDGVNSLSEQVKE